MPIIPPLSRSRVAATLPRAGICLMIVSLCSPMFALDRDQSLVQFHYTAWGMKDGAPSEISALAQTEDGYLWIGSPHGLFHFDGLKFEEYKPQPGVELPSHGIYSLLATPDGGLWIAFAPTGLGFLKDGVLTVFARSEELADSQIHDFACDQDGNIWASTETGLVLRNGTRWIPIGRDWNFAPSVIRHLFVDHEGTLWVATTKIITFLRRGSKAFEYVGAVGPSITTMAEAKDGRVWYADDSRGEVRPVPRAGHDSFAEDPAVVEDGLHELLIDREGALWVTRLDSGIVRIRYPERLENRRLDSRDHELESYGEKDGFAMGYAYKLFEDREGNIWVGCSKGLVRFRHNQVVPVSLPARYQKLVLFAGEGGGITVGTINSKPLLRIRGDDLLAEKVGEQTSSVFRGSSGDVWWGSAGGIWHQRGTTFQYFPIPKSAEPPHWIYEIFPAKDNGGLWIRLGDSGTVHFKKGLWNLNDRPPGIPLQGPSASYQDPSGRVWLGFTMGQVYLLDGEKVTAYSLKDGLDVGRIAVIRGLGQHIWVGGELGLMLFTGGQFRKVTVATGEQLGTVSGIVETADGGVWLNEMRGIVQIPPEEIRRFLADPNYRAKYRRFDYLDGLPGAPQMSFTNSTAVEASDGKLWFATDNGLAWIDPAHIVRNSVPPPVSILFIGNENRREPISSAVKFSAGTHAVEIDYAALSLSIPERVEFRYKLESVDKDWQNAGTRRQAFYTRLAPGQYRFHVIACNDDGIWNETGAAIEFSIAPAWYQTTLFGLVCMISAIFMIWTLHRLRVRQIAASTNARLGERLAERERIARELHDTLLQGFQGLVLHFQAALDKIPDREPAHQTMKKALSHADKVLSEGRGRVRDLRAEGVAADELSQELASYGAELAKERPIAFKLALVGSPRPLQPAVREESYRVAREALANAFRHSRASRIEAEINYDPRNLGVRVRDNGSGIDEETLGNGRKGHWGLSGMRERAKNISAQLSFWSNPGAGTEIELKVPAEIAYVRNSKQSAWNWIRRGASGVR